MKKNICAAVDPSVAEALNLFCERKINEITYRRSKSEIVNEALKEYFVRNGVAV